MPDPRPALKHPLLLILTILAAGDRHGYGIRQDILELTDDSVDIEAGTMYRHLQALEDDAYIATARAPRAETDDRRIYYRLTPAGRRVLAAEMARLRTLVRFAERNGILSPAGT
jgi:DNA-binding PadR family transcriptional regulator